MATNFIVLTGPLLTHPPSMLKHAIDAAVDKGLDQIGPIVAGYVASELHPGAGLLTGTFASSIHAETKKEFHMSLVRSHSGPPIRTWIELGTRRGSQTAFPGTRAFEKGSKRAESLDGDKYIGAHIVQALS